MIPIKDKYKYDQLFCSVKENNLLNNLLDFCSLENIFASFVNEWQFYIFKFNPPTSINISFILNFTISLFSLMLHCPKEKKSDESKYNMV